MATTIPTEADWRSEPWDLDIPYAYEHFAGKSRSEAVSLFKDNALYYQEDVMFMPTACFPFYAIAYSDYLLSEDSKGDCDGASCFFGLAEVRAAEIRSEGVLRHLAARQVWYDADPTIYGDFAKRAEKALSLIQQDGPNSQAGAD
jgi:hypothetical protein